MGVAVSGHRLARAVARAGQMGVVSGTALDTVLVRRLQDGDPDGDVRRALARFPDPDLAGRLLDRYYLPGGRPSGRPYRRTGLRTARRDRNADALAALAAFAEVSLAKEDARGPIGINLLTKIQLSTLPTLYGAMLAGVDWVLMGAGIPRDVPGVLDRFAEQGAASLRLDVADAPRGSEPVQLRFDPAEHGWDALGPLRRPAFMPIVASHALASMLLKRATGRIDGFVVEGPTAGGHNAPPRGPARTDADGAPRYGPRDVVDLDAVAALGLPFWLAGGTGTPEGLSEAHARGAAGIQVGTLFAYCDESGLDSGLKRSVVERTRHGDVRVRTDGRASPTGFPFKVADLSGTTAEPKVYEARERVCDLGYLREAAHGPDGRLAFRCPAEPVDAYVAKGGRVEDTIGRVCLCNGLAAAAGMPQVQKAGRVERPVVTSGDAIMDVRRVLKPGATGYAARDVVAFLTGVGEA